MSFGEICRVYSGKEWRFFMLDYTGVKCPVCQVPFLSDDDIVVCPECGAPYHRACYEKEHKCIFEEELHKNGKDWEPPAPPVAPDPTVEIKDQECPVCGTLNGHSALFCNRCGASLVGEPQRYHNSPEPPAGQIPPTYIPGPGFGGAFAFDPMGGVSPTEMLAENVSFGDVSKVVKQSTGYYMPVFRMMKERKRNKFSLSAFLFSGPWMLYRKQYKWGAIITALMFSLYTAYLFVSLYIASPALLDVMNKAGMDITQGFSPTSDQMIAITNILANEPGTYFQIALPLICLVCMLIVMIIVGIRGNKMYMKHCIKVVQEAKLTEAKSHESADAIMGTKGGVNVPIAICLLVSYMLISNIPMIL